MGPRRARDALRDAHHAREPRPPRAPGAADATNGCASIRVDNEQLLVLLEAQRRTSATSILCVVNLDPRTRASRAGRRSTSRALGVAPGTRRRGARPARATRRYTLDAAPRQLASSCDPARSRAAHVFQLRTRRPRADPVTPERRTGRSATPSRRARRDRRDPLWYKDAVIYELHVRAFFDSDGDGIGDFPGLTQKLDYLARPRRHRDLAAAVLSVAAAGTTATTSPTTRASTRHYGTLRDFKRFIREAHRRGLRVITELVLQPHLRPASVVPARASRAAGQRLPRLLRLERLRPDKYKDARIIFKDYETLELDVGSGRQRVLLAPLLLPPAGPELRQPARPRREFKKALDFWLDMGVDGLRLDADPVPLRARGHQLREPARDARVPARAARAHRRQLPRPHAARRGEPVAGGRGRLLRRSGDECHMGFHFPVMPRMFMALRMEDRFPIVDILAADAGHPDNCPVGALPAQPRRADARDGHRRRARLHVPRLRRTTRRCASTSASAAGSRRCWATTAADRADERPAVLAARHAGHLLRRRDRHGRQRLPRRPQRRAHADAVERRPQRRLLAAPTRSSSILPVITDPEYHYEAVNVEAQQSNPHSLLWWMKRLIALRKQHHAFGRGTLEFLHPDNRRIVAFVRELRGRARSWSSPTCRASSSTSSSTCRALPAAWCPVELFGRMRVPAHRRRGRYFLTLGPHGFYWFSLEADRVGRGHEVRDRADQRRTDLSVAGELDVLLAGRARGAAEPEHCRLLRARRWFAEGAAHQARSRIA